jgi:hypothetical protein
MTELSAVSSVSNFLEQAIKVEFSVLLPAGKPPESARKVAKEFYAKRGLDNPLLLGEVVVKAENTTRFNPENGAQLTDQSLGDRCQLRCFADMVCAHQQWRISPHRLCG